MIKCTKIHLLQIMKNYRKKTVIAAFVFKFKANSENLMPQTRHKIISTGCPIISSTIYCLNNLNLFNKKPKPFS